MQIETANDKKSVRRERKKAKPPHPSSPSPSLPLSLSSTKKFKEQRTSSSRTHLVHDVVSFTPRIATEADALERALEGRRRRASSFSSSFLLGGALVAAAAAAAPLSRPGPPDGGPGREVTSVRRSPSAPPLPGSKGPEFCAPCAMTQKLCPCRCSGWTPVSVLYTTRSTTSPNFRSRTLYPAAPGGALGGRAPAVSVASSSEGAAGAENVMLLKKKCCGLVEESTPVDSRMLPVLVEGWVGEGIVFLFSFFSVEKIREQQNKGAEGR